MAYQSVSLDQELFIKSIYTIHYYEYQNDFHFDGERHDFWEFQCVDTGAAEVVTDNGCHTLSRGQVSLSTMRTTLGLLILRRNVKWEI